MEFEKLPYSPDLKTVLIFPVAKISQKGTMFKWVMFNSHVSYMAGVRKRRGRKWGRETAREGGGELSFPFLSPSRVHIPRFPSLSRFNACHAGYSHMRCYITQWSATRVCGGLSVYSTPSPRKAQLKSPFGDSCYSRFPISGSRSFRNFR